MAEPLFTEYRRDLVARTFFDLKIAVAAAFASKFFLGFTWPVQSILWLVITTLGVLGFVFCPRQPPKKGGLF